MKTLTGTANILTMTRIVLIPIMIALFYIPGPIAAWTNLFLFAIAGITDFFDGYIARNNNETSAFGKFLDSIADKLVVIIILIMLIAFDRLEGLWVLPAAIIVSREILVSGLREFLGPYNIQVHVTKLAKWKTTVQMVTMGFLIAGDYGYDLVPYALEIGRYGLTIAAILTVITGWSYLKAGFETIEELDKKSS